MSFVSTSTANLFNSDDEYYEAEIAKRHAEMEVLLYQQEEKEQLEHQARRDAKVAEQKRLEEEAQRKEKEKQEYRKEKEHQRDLAYCLEADHVATIEQQCEKNWCKTFLSHSNPPSDEKMNLIDLLPLTKRKYV